MAGASFYTIEFTFREKQFTALVQDLGTSHWRVNFGHESGEIVREFGYVIEFFAHEVKSQKQPNDFKDFELAIRQHLRN